MVWEMGGGVANINTTIMRVKEMVREKMDKKPEIIRLTYNGKGMEWKTKKVYLEDNLIVNTTE